MSNLYWHFGVAADPNQLSAQVLYDHQYETEFADLTGEHFFKYWGNTIQGEYDSENARPGAMIMEHMDLKQGHSTLEIPVIVPDLTPAVYGDTDVKTLGVRDNITYISAGINRMKFTQRLTKGLQAQVLGSNLTARLNDASKALKRKLAQQTDKDLYHTMFTGSSIHLSDLSGKLNTRAFKAPHSHANFWTEPSGKVSYTAGLPGTPGYENSVVSALNSVDTQHTFNTNTIKALELQALRAKIPFFDTRFGKRRILIVNEYQLAQLREDPVYQRQQEIAFQGHGWEAPQFSNYRAQYSQSLIFSTITIPGIRTLGVPQSVMTNPDFNNMPYYTPAGWYDTLEMVDDTPLKLGILCGPDMIHKAYGQEAVTFTSFVDTSADLELLILSATMAYVLSDIVDKDGTVTGTPNNFYANRSSMVFATWSPVF